MVVLHIREGILRPGVSPDRVLLMGAGLLTLASLGFYYIEDLIDANASGSKLVNAFYCSVVTLTTIGYGDICPSSKASIGGKFFILAISMLGLGVFCGPLLSVTSAWRHQVPGGIITLSAFTLAMGTSIFSMVEGVDTLEAVYASIITGTTIGYGDLTPATDMGKMLVALYALLVVNVMGALLETGKEYLLRFCMLPPQLAVPDSVAAHVASEVKDKKDL